MTNQPQLKGPVMLPELPILFPEYNETERGNILLSHNEEPWLNAWLRLPGKENWLQISYRNCNYPALNVSTINITDADLALHIRKHFADDLWYVHKMRLEGVLNDMGDIMELPEGEERLSGSVIFNNGTAFNTGDHE